MYTENLVLTKDKLPVDMKKLVVCALTLAVLSACILEWKQLLSLIRVFSWEINMEVVCSHLLMVCSLVCFCASWSVILSVSAVKVLLVVTKVESCVGYFLAPLRCGCCCCLPHAEPVI